jgi:AcrR family transcriptional regulator
VAPSSGPAPRPRQRLSVAARRAQLLSLGIAAFARQSYDAVAIEAIATAAGISKGLLYHYFPTKRDFYVATVRVAANDLLACTDTPTDLPPLVRLEAGLAAFMTYVEQHGPAFSALLRGGVGTDVEVAAVVETTRSALVERLTAGLGLSGPNPLQILALRGWVGFVEAVSLEWLERRQPTPDAVCRLLVMALPLILSGVEADP